MKSYCKVFSLIGIVVILNIIALPNINCEALNLDQAVELNLFEDTPQTYEVTIPSPSEGQYYRIRTRKTELDERGFPEDNRDVVLNTTSPEGMIISREAATTFYPINTVQGTFTTTAMVQSTFPRDEPLQLEVKAELLDVVDISDGSSQSIELLEGIIQIYTLTTTQEDPEFDVSVSYNRLSRSGSGFSQLQLFHPNQDIVSDTPFKEEPIENFGITISVNDQEASNNVGKWTVVVYQEQSAIQGIVQASVGSSSSANGAMEMHPWHWKQWTVVMSLVTMMITVVLS